MNDTLGHLAGDQLLCGIADALLATTRPGDVAARWGGDEFIVLGDADAALYAAKAAGGAQMSLAS